MVSRRLSSGTEVGGKRSPGSTAPCRPGNGGSQNRIVGGNDNPHAESTSDKELRMTVHGVSTSAAAMEIYSGPTMLEELAEITEDERRAYVKAAWIMQENTPQNRPVSPETRYDTKAA